MADVFHYSTSLNRILKPIVSFEFLEYRDHSSLIYLQSYTQYLYYTWTHDNENNYNYLFEICAGVIL